MNTVLIYEANIYLDKSF